MEARIVRLFGAFAYSFVMVVRIDCPAFALDGNEDVVLKVYDRRNAPGARKNEKMQPWSLELEKEYVQFAREDAGSKFINALDSETEEPPRSEAKLWNASQEEAYLHSYLTALHDTEIEAYNILRDFQGKEVPRLLADVKIPVSDPDMPEPHKQSFSGVLLQHIPGFLLRHLADNAPRELWQPICDDAIRIINLMGDQGILNKGADTGSFIVNLDVDEGSGFKLTMINFNFCNFREEYETEEEWNLEKAIEEEEEEIGLVMQSKLDEAGGGFVYHRSGRYTKPDSANEL